MNAEIATDFRPAANQTNNSGAMAAVKMTITISMTSGGMTARARRITEHLRDEARPATRRSAWQIPACLEDQPCAAPADRSDDPAPSAPAGGIGQWRDRRGSWP